MFGSGTNFKIPIFTGPLSPEAVVLNIVNYVLIFIGIFAVGYLIYGGVMFLTSGGDSEKTTKARNTILYAIVGIVIIVLSYSIYIWAANSLVNTITK